MAGDAEQTDSSGKYTFGGGGAVVRRQWPTVLKGIEVILCILCIGLFDDPAHNSRIRSFAAERTISFSYVTFGAFLIFTITYLIGKVIRDEWPWKTSAILSGLATFLFLICGILVIRDWSNAKALNYWPPNTTRLDLLCATGFISVITAITFLVDLILTIRAGNRGDFDDQ